jgi:Mor family transcriptional regulator
VVAALAEYLGARPIYLPRGDALKTALLHQSIWHEWDGRSETKWALAKRHKMSVRSIERIIAEQAALHRDRFQGKLFADSYEGRQGS